ncbi:MAG: segregation/condensation protein A [Alphaproteobacteria bacterium]|nr:segregation/condensation protein A [Alphaproteobacteria bacterium]
MNDPEPLPQPTDFSESDPPRETAAFVVSLDGFDGPLDLLLNLARQQKVDLKSLSILRLAEQYLDYIAAARRLKLEVAADYLVMAAWLAYLKSRLLLPEPAAEEGLSGEAMAALLQLQLGKLETMRKMAAVLMAGPRLGLQVFQRGQPEGIRVLRRSLFECSLSELLSAYARQDQHRAAVAQLRLAPPPVFAIEAALQRLSALLGGMPDWATLEAFLPADLRTAFDRRSALASTFAASLELAKSGRVALRQARPFGPILLRRPELP